MQRARWLGTVALLLLTLRPVCAADALNLKVLYIASSDPGRTAAFADFLRARFTLVRIAALKDFDPKTAGNAEVVLLDWSKLDSDAIRAAWETLKAPLGGRDQWSKPTVLLGGAEGMILAPWQMVGSYG